MSHGKFISEQEKVCLLLLSKLEGKWKLFYKNKQFFVNQYLTIFLGVVDEESYSSCTCDADAIINLDPPFFFLVTVILLQWL